MAMLTSPNAEGAKAAVFVKSHDVPVSVLSHHVVGPNVAECHQGVGSVLNKMESIGYQATNFGKSINIVNEMLRGRALGMTIQAYSEKIEGDKILEGETTSLTAAQVPCIPAVIFLGVTANLFGSSVREAIAFLCKYALIDVIVVSGGAIEHDLRRTVDDNNEESYQEEEKQQQISKNNIEREKNECTQVKKMHGYSCARAKLQQYTHDGKEATLNNSNNNNIGQFGNIRYEKYSPKFNALMTKLTRIIADELYVKKQKQLHSELKREELINSNNNNNNSTNNPTNNNNVTNTTPFHSSHHFYSLKPRTHQDDLLCDFAMPPSLFWRRVGELLPSLVAQGRAETSVAYWAFVNRIPIYSPSIVDGDLMRFMGRRGGADDIRGEVLRKDNGSREEKVENNNGIDTNDDNINDTHDDIITKKMPLSPSFGITPSWMYASPYFLKNRQYQTNPFSHPSSSLLSITQGRPLIQFDLIQDICSLNRMAIWAKKTGMLILGGGVVKHHVCNANLFRNGADYSVYINNAQEFDGSDSGARPDEAVSWGKIKMTAEAVKVYAEVSLVFPLLVGRTFAEYLRKKNDGINSHNTEDK